MANSNSSSRKSNRHADMDSALFDALASEVPNKNTGPDPDDILRDIIEEEADARWQQNEEHRNIAVALDDIDRQRVEQIVELVRRQTGEQIDRTQAIKIALSLCSMDAQAIGVAHAQIAAQKRRD